MRSRSIVALGLGVVAVAALPLLTPGTVLATRDTLSFHLPLQNWFWSETSSIGRFPHWNPAINQGQPTLSNPNYLAFYPPSWIGLKLSADRWLGAMVWLHLLWGTGGIVYLSRRFGASVAASVLAGIGFGLGLPLTRMAGILPVFLGTTWLPWVLALGIDAGRGCPRKLVLGAAALALQFLSGEPMMPLASGLGLLLIVVFGPATDTPRVRALRSLLTMGLVAAGLAAVQILPTAYRVAGTARGAGLPAEEALKWSLAPERLIEWVLPSFHGYFHRIEFGEYFGCGASDCNAPYVEVLGPAGAMWVLAAAGILSAGPWRKAIAALFVVSVLLALGRYNPGFVLLRELPPFSWFRFPQKWILLATVAAYPAAALGFDRWRTERSRTVMVCAAILCSSALAWSIWLRSDAGAQWVGIRGGEVDGDVAQGLTWLQSQAALTGIVAALTLLCGWLARARPRDGRSAVLVMVSLAVVPAIASLGGALFTVPSQLVLTPPAVLEKFPVGHRILDTLAFDGVNGVSGAPSLATGANRAFDRVRLIEPYTAALYGHQYAFNLDYDRMLTAWGRYALDAFLNLEGGRIIGEKSYQLAGNWAVAGISFRRDQQTLEAEVAAGNAFPDLVEIVENPWYQPEVRAVERIDALGSQAAAAQAAEQAHWHGGSTWTAESPAVHSLDLPSSLSSRLGSDVVTLEWTSSSPIAVVVARTFDAGWSATLDDGRVARLVPTALGQILLELPAAPRGAAATLQFRDRHVMWGAATTVATLLGCALWLLAVRRKAGASQR